MKQSSKHQLHSKQLMRSAGLRSDGFVLVAVLLIIALAVVLVVTTSSVSQIERKAISNSANQELARQNALFALNLAVSQLQVAAGPDQRVTATADILNTNNAQISPVAQPYWAGVWKSYNPAYTPSPWFRPEPLDIDTSGNVGTSITALRPWSVATMNAAQNTNMTWLVSGATNNPTISPLSSTTSWMTSSIVLASNWGTGTNGSLTSTNGSWMGATWTNPTTVTVPLVKLTNGTTNVGKYAYWVSDEGVKAKVTLTDTNMSTAAITSVNNWIPSLLHYFAPPAMNVSSVMTNFGITTVLTTDFRSNTNLIKMTSLGGLALITNSVPVFTNNTLAADLTPYGYGVLSDTRMGGLRQDLTAAFESTSSIGATNFNTLKARSGTGTGNDAVMVYRVTNTSIPAYSTPFTVIGGSTAGQAAGVSTIFDGLRWQSLYFYYNNYKSSMTISPISTNPTLGTSPNGVGLPSVGGSPNYIQSRNPLWPESQTTGLFIMNAMAPVEIADRLDTAVTAIGNTVLIAGTNYPGYNFRLRYYPMVVLHNPYTVNLIISNTANMTVTKNILGITPTLSSTTNKITNASWQYTTGPTNAPTTNTVSGKTNTNLFPYTYAGGYNATATAPQTQLLPGSGYPLNQTCTNLTTMAPGEIRVFALLAPASVNITNLANVNTFTNLVSTTNTTLDAYQYVDVGTNSSFNYWKGTTNPADTVSLTLSALNVGGYNTLRLYDSKGTFTAWPGGINQYGFPSAFPGALASPVSMNATDAGWTTPTIGGMQVYRMLGQFERLKGVNSANDPTFGSSSTNLPLFMGNSISLNAGRSGVTTVNNPTTEVYAVARNQMSSFTLLYNKTNGSNLTTSWGNSAAGKDPVITTASAQNNCQICLKDIPIAPMTSLGQFMHFEECYFDRGYTSLNIPAMSVGGSFASPEVGLASSAYFVSGPFATPSIDNSYMGNEALFDTYFFSTVPPTSGFNWGSGGYGAFSNSSITAASIAAGLPLPNSRLVYYRKNGSNPAVANLQDESKASANLLLDGAFNVNSTSVAAWKALLTSLSGHTFHTYNYLTKTGEDRNLLNPIPRFWSVSRSAANDPWDGMRSLTDAQVTILATEIVKQVRLRGPFLSLSDFLNRRLGLNTTSPLSLVTMGAIQAAIENTQTNVPASTYDANYNIHSSGIGTGAVSKYKPVAATGIALNGVADIVTNTAAGIPGYLMQQDIVQAFAPVLAARSDTFVIRVYGESDKPSTNSVATTNSQAWGEAVVQRLPEYFDQTDAQLASTTLTGYALGDATPPYSSAGAVLNSANQTLGRRFKIISFRWLNQNEL